MTLDVKAMEWAAENGIDTAKLKAAKVPVYGKWYFPEIPANVPLVNLKTGEVQLFGPGLRAGEVLFVARSDLLRARLGPYARLNEQPEAAPASATVQAPTEPEPAQPAPAQPAPASAAAAAAADEEDGGEPIHLPNPSIFPLILGLGLAFLLLGLVAGPPPTRIFIFMLGVAYCFAGAVGWVMENHRAGEAHAPSESH